MIFKGRRIFDQSPFAIAPRPAAENRGSCGKGSDFAETGRF